MKVISWNVNGIRSRIFNDKISSKLKKNQEIIPEENSPIQKLLEQDVDIICIQETRCSVENSKFIKIPGYKSFFNQSDSEEAARSANRYSGTAIFYKENLKPEFSTQIPGYSDTEGRIIIMDIPDKFKLISVYAPNSGSNFDKKILFQEKMALFLESIKDQNVIFCGDLNVAIETWFFNRITPNDDYLKFDPSPGYYAHEVGFYDTLVKMNYKDGFTDSNNFTWWDPRQVKENGMSRARNRDKGWRLDYFFTKNINQVSCNRLKYIGENNKGIPLASDHCPIILETD